MSGLTNGVCQSSTCGAFQRWQLDFEEFMMFECGIELADYRAGKTGGANDNDWFFVLRQAAQKLPLLSVQ